MTNKKNFERINYALRPAKHIERKMFCETFGRLSVLDNLRNYRYIGMGSAYFSDFNLFHKTLGIDKLISIEGEDDLKSKQRVNFNKPFACIDLKFGWTNVVLPKLPWDDWKEKSIVWLDYVSKLNEVVLGDIETVILKIKPGSMFLISVDIQEDDERDPEENPERLSAKDFKFKKLKDNVGSDLIPEGVENLVLNIENNKLIIWQIINNSILNAVKIRNGGYAEEDRLMYKQIFNLHYRDSADMLTVGGIFYNPSQYGKVNHMFDNLGFVRSGRSCFSIKVPKLTYREIHALDKAMPTNKGDMGVGSDYRKIPLSPLDKKNYSEIYRYFPTFVETNL